MRELSGSIVALVTPFRDGKLDLKALKKLVEFQIQAGTRGIVPCGTTGESPTLSHAEHEKVIAATVDSVRGRVAVIAGTGSNSTSEAVSLTKFAKKVGADASLSVVPYYNKPTQEGLYQHFKEIATKSKLPIVLYNIPGRSGVALSIDTIVKLSKVDYVTSIKEATGSLDMATAIACQTPLVILSGDDSLTLPLMSVGAKGVISVIANIFPQEVAALVNSIECQEWDEAKKMHYQMFPLVKSLFLETNPIPVKEAMQMMRLCSGDMRLPMCRMQKDNKLKLKIALEKYQAVLGARSLSGARL